MDPAPSPEANNTQNSDHITINLKKMDRTRILTLVVSITLVLTLINTYGIFFKNPGSITGGTIQEPSAVPTVPTSAQQPQPQPARITVKTDDAPLKGKKEAAITIVEFSDYECPFCGRHFQQVYPQLIKDYVETGKAKLYFRDFPLNFHPNAQKAAEAAHCMRDQKGDDGYFQMHDKLFQNQQTLNPDNYVRWARELGAESEQFANCLNNGKFAKRVQDDLSYGQTVGVQGTPAFFINGRQLTGAQPYEAFKQILDEELKK